MKIFLTHCDSVKHIHASRWQTIKKGRLIELKISNNLTFDMFGFSTGDHSNAINTSLEAVETHGISTSIDGPIFDSDSESLSPDPFLQAVDQGLFNLENAIDPIISGTAQTDISGFDIEELMCSYLKTELGSELPKKFKMSDLKYLFEEKQILKMIIDNNLKRTDKHSPHSTDVRDYFVMHALKFSLASAAAMSSDLGGPGVSTLKQRSTPKIKILPYIEEENLSQHTAVLKDVLQKSFINDSSLSYSKLDDIPIQISIDATAINGKLSTRKLEKFDDKLRLIYGLNSGINQQPLMNCSRKMRIISNFLLPNARTQKNGSS